MKQGVPSFDDLISPVTLQEFFSVYWERRHLFLSRKAPSFYDHVFSLADVDSAIAASGAFPHEVLDLIPPPDSGRKIESFKSSRVVMDRIYAGLGRGDTVRLMGLQQVWPTLARLAGAMGEAFSAEVNFNFYLTPAGSQGFPVHVDTHEACILQVEGSKDWFIYEAEYPLPLNTLNHMEEMKAKSRLTPDEQERRLVAEIHLEKGDFLYIPRGVPHKAVASNEHSLHLTAGIHPLYWVDFLKRAVEIACGDEVGLRRSLPANYARSPASRVEMAGIFQSLLGGLPEVGSLFERTLETFVKARIGSRTFPPDGHVEQILQPVEIDMLTLFERRDGLECGVERSDTSATITFGPGSVSGPAGLAPAFEYIRDNKRFRLADLPIRLDEKSKVVLARRLVRGGLLRVCGEAAEVRAAWQEPVTKASE
jgi:ribosomal protein L16 Arg81 hydroxylase